jgi:hypothetical protein
MLCALWPRPATTPALSRKGTHPCWFIADGQRVCKQRRCLMDAVVRAETCSRRVSHTQQSMALWPPQARPCDTPWPRPRLSPMHSSVSHRASAALVQSPQQNACSWKTGMLAYWHPTPLTCRSRLSYMYAACLQSPSLSAPQARIELYFVRLGWRQRPSCWCEATNNRASQRKEPGAPSR